MSIESTWRCLALPARLRTWSVGRRQLPPSLRGGNSPNAEEATQAVAIHTPPPTGQLELDPKQCVLLILGCQPGILSEVPDGEALLLKINAVTEKVRCHGGHIGYVRIAFDGIDYRFTPTTNKEFSALAREARLQDGTPESAIHESLTVRSTDIAVRAKRLGAFSTTDLDEQLTNLGVTTLIVCGIHTSGAVLSTVREAADRDYRLIVLSDTCADPTPSTHELLMARIFPRQGEIASATDVFSSLSSAKAVRSGNSPTGETSQVS